MANITTFMAKLIRIQAMFQITLENKSDRNKTILAMYCLMDDISSETF